MQVGEVFVKIGADLSGFKSGIQSVKTGISGLGSAIAAPITGAFAPIGRLTGMLTNVQNIATGVMVGGVGAGAWKWLVQGNADMEQYQQTLGIVLKDTKKAAETLAWAQKFAAQTPFEIPQIVDATTKLSAYGITAQKVLPDIGNMAAALGKPLNQAVEAIADAQTGELERLKEFGITKTMLIQKAAEMGKKEIVNAKGQITDMKGLNAALFQIMHERYDGAMKAQSTSLNGMMSNLKDWLGTAGRVMGKGLFDKLKPALQSLLDYLNKLTADGKLEKWAANAGAALSGMFSAIGAVGKVAVQVGGWIKDHWSILEPILAGVLGGFMAFKTITYLVGVINAIKTAFAAFNLVVAANPIGLACVAIGLLIAAGVALYRNWDTVKAKTSQLWASIKGTFVTVGNSVVAFFKQWGITLLMLTPLAPFIALFTKQGREVVNGLIKGVGSMAGALKNYIKGFISNNIVNPIKNVLGIRSPSKVTQWHGEMVVAGMTAGITKASPQAEKAAKKSGEKVAKEAEKQAKAAAKAAERAYKLDVAKMDKLGDALIQALRKKYEQQERIQTKALDREVENAREASDKKMEQYDKEYNAKLKVLDAETAALLKPLQDQIDAINGKTEAEERAIEEAEYQNKIAELQKAINTAESVEDREAAEKELQEAITEHERKQLLQSRQDQIDALRDEMDRIKQQAEDKKAQLEEEYETKKDNEQKLLEATIDRLETEKEEIQAHFEKLKFEENLNAEARKLIIGNNQREIVNLLATYNSDWMDAGKSFGENLVKGIESTIPQIQAAVADAMSPLNENSGGSNKAGGGSGSSGSGTASGKTYIVKAGDTLSKIANLFKTTVQKIASFNGIKDVNKILVGQVLKIPAYFKGGLIKSPTIASFAEKEPEWAIPHSKLGSFLKAAMGGLQYNAPLVHVDTMVVRDDSDIRSISRELFALQNNSARSRGVRLSWATR